MSNLQSTLFWNSIVQLSQFKFEDSTLSKMLWENELKSGFVNFKRVHPTLTISVNLYIVTPYPKKLFK